MLEAFAIWSLGGHQTPSRFVLCAADESGKFVATWLETSTWLWALAIINNERGTAGFGNLYAAGVVGVVSAVKFLMASPW